MKNQKMRNLKAMFLKRMRNASLFSICRQFDSSTEELEYTVYCNLFIFSNVDMNIYIKEAAKRSFRSYLHDHGYSYDHATWLWYNC